MNTKYLLTYFNSDEINTDISTESGFEDHDIYLKHTFTYNGKVFSLKRLRQFDIPTYSDERITYSLCIDNKYIYNPGYLSELFTLLTQVSYNYSALIAVLFNQNTDERLYTFSKELCERLDEFEVIKDKKLDYISLQSFYEYYDWEFDKNQFDLQYKNMKATNVLI